MCDKGFSWNPSNCECECDKSCEMEEYLDYKSCVCKKTLARKLLEQCTSVIEENKTYNKTLNVTSSNDCVSCTVYVVLFVVFLLLCSITSSVFFFIGAKGKIQKKIMLVFDLT